VSTEGAQPRIFISYRRDDSQGFARSMHDRLAQHFGPDAVFRDVNDIEPGRPWAEAIDHALASCDVFVLLIGRRWLEATDDEGNRRLDDPEDRHRREIETAVNRRVRIFVALMEDAHMPRRKELPNGSPGEKPTGLQLVPALHALRIADHAFDYGIEELVTNIERATEQTHTREEPTQQLTAESRQREVEELAGVEEEHRNHTVEERAQVTTDGEPVPTQPAERPPTVPVEPPAGRQEELTAIPAEPPGPVTQPPQKASTDPDGGRGRRRIGPAAVVVLVAAVAAVALGLVVLDGGDEIEFEELTTDDYQLEVPTGWNPIADEESQTRLEDPSGAMLLGINQYPSVGVREHVQQAEEVKEVEDVQYQSHAQEEVAAPPGAPGAPGVYWEFDADLPQVPGDELYTVFAYFFDVDGTIYRIQCAATVASGQADVAEEVARHAVDTLEVF